VLRYFLAAKCGAPPKIAAVAPAAAAAPVAMEEEPPPLEARGSKPCLSRMNWNTDENFALLHRAVVSFVEDGDDHEAICLIPPQTLCDNAKNFAQLAKEHRIPLSELTHELVYPVTFGGLLTEEQVSQLNAIIIHQDEANNGIGRGEIIELVQQFAQLADVKKAENHYDYLIKNKCLIGLKCNGRVFTAQKTSSKHCQIMVEQQLWWHTMVDDAHAELRRLNQPTAEFDQLSEYFIGNFDKSCFMAS